MEQARDFWAMADRSLLDRWPKGADGQPEKAEKLTWQPELVWILMLILFIVILLH